MYYELTFKTKYGVYKNFRKYFKTESEMNAFCHRMMNNYGWKLI